MRVAIDHIQVMPDFMPEVMVAYKENHSALMLDEANIRLEAYANDVASTVHQQTSHFRNWCNCLESWMAVTRQGVTDNGLCPE